MQRLALPLLIRPTRRSVNDPGCCAPFGGIKYCVNAVPWKKPVDRLPLLLIFALLKVFGPLPHWRNW